jgi:hypothetical protein
MATAMLLESSVPCTLGSDAHREVGAISACACSAGREWRAIASATGESCHWEIWLVIHQMCGVLFWDVLQRVVLLLPTFGVGSVGAVSL